MSKSKKIFLGFGYAIFLLNFTAENVHAYIDPGAGSYMLQLAVASILGIGYATKLYWGKIKSFLIDIFRRWKTKI